MGSLDTIVALEKGQSPCYQEIDPGQVSSFLGQDPMPAPQKPENMWDFAANFHHIPEALGGKRHQIRVQPVEG